MLKPSPPSHGSPSAPTSSYPRGSAPEMSGKFSPPSLSPPHPPPPTPLHPIFRTMYEQKLNFDHLKSQISSDPSCLGAVNVGNGYIPLHAAARRGDPSLMRLLIASGSSLDVQARYGETPFLIACQIGILRVVHILADAGADTRISDHNGKCAIHYASEVGSVPVLHYLVYVLRHDVCSTDKLGNTALHYAVQERVTLSTSYLLKRKECDLRATNHQGFTPVHVAAKTGSMKMMWDMLSSARRTDDILSIRTSEGLTPLDMAKQGRAGGHKTLVRHLPWWKSHPQLMRNIPWVYWLVYTCLTGLCMIVAAFAFCYLPNSILAVIVGVAIGVIGFIFPVRPHRISHESGWHNPAFMGAVFTEIGHTALSYCVRILPLLWPGNIFIICCFVVNTVFGLYIFLKIKTTDPGFDKTGKIGSNGKPLSVLDVAKEEHNLSFYEVKKDALKPSPSVLQFCRSCEIVIPDRTKHCKLCNACCNGFDHHCMWLTSCIGYNNHRLFVLFNLSLAIEAALFLWDGVRALSTALGDNFPWGIVMGEGFEVERWVKFRMLVTLCSLVFVAHILYDQLCNISRLETAYFDRSGNAAFGQSRTSELSWRTRLWLVWLFFVDYRKWYRASDLVLLSNSTSKPAPHYNV